MDCRLLAAHIRRKFGVSYCISGALALAKRMRFSVRMPRPIPRNMPDKKVIDEYVTNTTSAIKSHVAAGYSVYCLDAAGFADLPSSARGLRLVGGHETVETNFGIKTTKAIGALEVDTLHLNFYDKANSENVIDLLEQIRQYNPRIFVILDNASAHKSQEIMNYVKKARGHVVLWYLPPRTLQHNPIEIVWQEIKRAIAGRYFGSFEKMHEAIRRLFCNGEVAIVKLLKYMLDAIKVGRGKTLPVLVPA